MAVVRGPVPQVLSVRGTGLLFVEAEGDADRVGRERLVYAASLMAGSREVEKRAGAVSVAMSMEPWLDSGQERKQGGLGGGPIIGWSSGECWLCLVRCSAPHMPVVRPGPRGWGVWKG